ADHLSACTSGRRRLTRSALSPVTSSEVAGLLALWISRVRSAT
ncbi:MAG: hypothetical protein JWM62_666, partial [Frankiales bacterium]|nr:hypothetical protein [Frankiales bacterium]